MTRKSVESDSFPLSFGQEQLWFLEQLTPGTPTYNVAILRRVTGPLDHTALQAAVHGLVTDHEILRVRFGAEDGVPHQVVTPAPNQPLTITDLRAAHPDRQQATEAALAAIETVETTPFDLATGPLYRFQLFQVADDEHLFSLVIHHIVCDGWSVNLVGEEIADRYAARTGHGTPRPTATGPRFRDVVAKQWERRQAGELDASIGFWTKQLANLPTLELPADRPRPALAGHEGASLAVSWPASLRAALATTAAARGVSMTMLVTAALAVVLGRYGREVDVPIGTTALGRLEPEWEHVVGLFVNVVVLRVDLSGDPTFAALLKRVRATVLDALDNQEVPFERVVDAVGAPRDPSRNPLFQVLVQVQEQATGAGTFTLPGAEVTAVGRELTRSRFDLSLSIADTEDEFGVGVEYSTELYDSWRITQLVRHVRHILETIVADQEIPLSALDPMSAEDRARVLEFGRGADVELRTDPAYVLVDEHAAATPDAVAIAFEGTELTYGQLSRRVDLLAGWLRLAHGVRHEEYVAVALDRGPWAIAAMMAVSKAGGAYVVLDIDHPVNRLEFILDDSAVRVVLTTSDLLPMLPEAGDRHYVCVDVEWPAIEADQAGRTAPLPPVSTGDSLANLLYTSGTTGRPKGVFTEHRAFATYFAHMARTFGLGPGHRVLQFANLAFDLCQAEIFATLTSGATLVCAPKDTLHTPERLAELIRAERLTFVAAPPTMLAMLDPEPYPDLRNLFVGGEACPAEIANRWNTGDRLFVNGYGPTEAAIGVTMHPVAKIRYRMSPPIGGPMPDRLLYVVDPETDALLPVGVPGELLIGGDEGLARGYLNQPELTAEKFVPDPFRDTGRVYRTGDLARWNPDGDLEFLGRIDTQVKLRGLRIELEEIETILLGYPTVRQAAVTKARDARGEDILAAYVTAAVGARLDLTALRAHLKEFVPAYMVPTAWMVLDAMPVSNTGKLRRNALPAPVSDDGAEREVVEPSTAAERFVAGTVAEVLSLKAGRVGVNDDFFALGGNSLQAMRVVSRVNKRFGTRIGVRTLYGAPTLGEFAGEVAAAAPAPVEPEQSAPVTHPENDAAADIAAIFGEVLGREGVGPEDNLYALGGHDTAADAVLTLVRQRRGIALTPRDLFTPSVLAAAVAAHRWSPLVPLTEDTGRYAPLFCLPGANGTATVFAGLARTLTSDRPVIALEAPGLEPGRTPLDRVPDLADEFLRAIRARQPHGPYHLLGWSLGGQVAGEIAGRLRADGESVAFLAVVDTGFLAGQPMPTTADVAALFVADIAAESGLPAPAGTLPDFDDKFDEFYALLHDTVLPAEIEADDLRRRLEVFRAGTAAAHSHRPVWTHPGRLDVIRAVDGAAPGRAAWLTRVDEVREYRVPGDHFSLWSAAHRPVLAAVVDTLLGTVEQ